MTKCHVRAVSEDMLGKALQEKIKNALFQDFANIVERNKPVAVDNDEESSAFKFLSQIIPKGEKILKRKSVGDAKTRGVRHSTSFKDIIGEAVISKKKKTEDDEDDENDESGSDDESGVSGDGSDDETKKAVAQESSSSDEV